MKNQFKKMKGSNGITLIALVITIIVLLILAGATIAMLSGENGIVTNAQEAKSQQAYTQAEEQMKLAYMAVRTEIATKTALDGTYNATEDMDNLLSIVRADLSGDKWSVSYDTNNVITMTYVDSAIDQYSNGDTPTQEGEVTGTITVEEQSASFGFDEEIEIEGGDDNTGDDNTGDDTSGNSAIIYPEGKTASTVAVGETITIEEEQFMVFSNDGSTIKAMPYYNITLDLNNPEQSSSTGTIAFSSSKYWPETGRDIDMTHEDNNIQQYIEAYQTKLQGIAGNSVTARVARYSEMNSTEMTNTLRNPGQTDDNYWLGSWRANYPSKIYYVLSSGRLEQPSLSYSDTSYCGVHPVIEISIS